MSDPPNVADELLQYDIGRRHLRGAAGFLIPALAASWSIFQLAVARYLLLNSELVRCIHLAFALSLVYLSCPAIRRRRTIERLQNRNGHSFAFLWDGNKLGLADLTLAALAAVASLYLAWDYQGIGQRLGAPLPRDLLVGMILVVLLLEGARRALGLALPVIAGIFILYSFISEWMPAIISFKNASLGKVLNKLTLTTEGIYGVPLDVSASVVFLFVLFGSMLEKSGGGQYFIDLAFSVLGRFRGGPGKAAVLASGLTGMVNGSSIANTVTTGTFTIPLMKRAGYSSIKAGAIEVAASTNGQLMPPVMGAAAFIIAEYCNLTYFEVVRAAFVPATISYLALIYITHLEAVKINLQPIPADELPAFWPTFFRGIHFLIPIAFLLYQLIVAQRSAQLSAYYAILTLALLILVRDLVVAVQEHRSIGSGIRLGLSRMGASLVAGGRNMMSIGVAVAAAGIIVGIITLGLGSVMTELIGLLSGGNLVGLLLITALVSLVLGMGLPTTANYIVMATLTAPAILALAGDAGLVVPIIAAHLFCFYFGILSDDTPPVGLSAYAAAAISGADPIRTGIQGFIYDIRTAILPFMFIFNTDLLLIGVESWWHIAGIFIAGMMGMFAFAAFVQHHVLVRNRFHESAILVVAVLLSLRPGLFEATTSLPRWGGYLLGIAAFATVYALQWPRARMTTKD